MNKRVLVLGNNTVDHVFMMRTAALIDGKLNANSYHAYAGGQAANAAVDMALFGLDVIFAGSFGDDDMAGISRRAFEAVGVDLTHTIVVPSCRHHVAAVLVAEEHRSIIMYRDPRLALDDLVISEDMVARCAAVYTDGHEGEASLRLARLAAASGTPLVSDLETVASHSAELAALATHLIAPAGVLRQLGGRDSLVGAMYAVLGTGPSVVVATMGRAGSIGLSRSEGPHEIPAAACSVVDTTGAGDAFHAGYVVSLLRGEPLRRRLEYASAVAAIKCSIKGPRLTAEGIEAAPRGMIRR